MNRVSLSFVALVTLVAATACGGKAAAPTAPPAPAPAPAPPLPEVPVSTAPSIVAQTAAPQQLTFPTEAFRAEQPKPGPARPFRLPKIKPFTLKNGVKVFLVEQHELPLVQMDLSFDGGSVTDPKGKEGLASVCMGMLTEGTEQLDKLQYAEALADIASNVSSYASDDASGISLSSLSKHLDATFALFVDTLRTPGFRAPDFERLVKRRQAGVKQSKGTVSSVAGRVSSPVLYGLAHPMGTVVTEESLAAITLDDCKAYVAKWFKPAGAKLFVVGDLTEAQIRAYFDKAAALASWKGTAPKPAALPAPKTLAGRIFFVHVPGSAQSQVSMMHFGPKRTAPDYFATTLMGAVFGGGFASRINMNLREDKGYSYGARGSFGYSKHYGTFSASASVQSDTTYQSLLEIDREVKELWAGKRPIVADELDREKHGQILGLPGQFATAQAALGQYRRLVYFGLPLDYYGTYVTKVGAVNLAQVKASAAKQLRPGQAVYLVVGDGDAPMNVGEPETVTDPATGKQKTVWKRVPYKKGDKQLTLREALADLAARGDVGAGGLVELDTDGRPKS